MKKHFFSLTALSLAILFSAFSKPKIAQKQSFDDPELTWYLVNGSGQINVNNPINPNDPMTAGELQETYYPLCDTGTEVDCVRGFNPQFPPVYSTDQGVEQLKKDQ